MVPPVLTRLFRDDASPGMAVVTDDASFSGTDALQSTMPHGVTYTPPSTPGDELRCATACRPTSPLAYHSDKETRSFLANFDAVYGVPVAADAAVSRAALPAPSPLRPVAGETFGTADSLDGPWAHGTICRVFAGAYTLTVVLGIAGVLLCLSLAFAMLGVGVCLSLAHFALSKLATGVVIVHRDPELAGAVDFVRLPALHRLLGAAWTTTRFDVATVELVATIDTPSTVRLDTPFAAEFVLRDATDRDGTAIRFASREPMSPLAVIQLNVALAAYFESIRAAVAAVAPLAEHAANDDGSTVDL